MQTTNILPHVSKDDDNNVLKMIQKNYENYNKLKRLNKRQLSYKSNHPRQDEINAQLQILYQDLDYEFHNFKSLSYSSCFKHKLVRIDKNNPVVDPNLLKGSYIPLKIKNYIIENATILLEYTCNLDSERTVKINFIIFNDSYYELNNIKKKSASYFKHCVLKIYIWLKMLSKYSNKECGKNLECFIYLTPFKRKLPHSSDLENNIHASDDSGEDDSDGDASDQYNIYQAGTLGAMYNKTDKTDNTDKTFKPYHVNGGLSDICQIDGQIIVYRREEWFKVFIHETMHNYGLDFSNLNMTESNRKLMSIFSIQHDVKLFESYCEIWARIMNVFFESYFETNQYSKTLFRPLSTRKKLINKIHKIHNIDKINKNRFNSTKKVVTNHLQDNKSENDIQYKFLNIFYDNIQHESIFSIFQCVKILSFMGLDYDIITNVNHTNYTTVKKLYKEQTNVFAYYIIVAILISNFNNFILWCIDNNTNLFNFKKNQDAIESFIMFIYDNYKNNDLLKMIVESEKKINNNIGMDIHLLNTMRMTVIGGN